LSLDEIANTPEIPEEETAAAPHRDRVSQIAGIAGKVLIGSGVIVLLFVLFQIFGTSYIQKQHQTTLRNSFEQQLKLVPTTAPTANAGPPVTTGPQPAPGLGQPIAILEIPAIKVNQVVIQGTTTSQLQYGPGHYTTTPLPGQAGNVGIAGHRTTWGHPFYNLNALKAGDKIILSTTYGTFTYSMTTSQIVEPTAVEVLNPTLVPTLTLTTCNPRYSAAQRLVVQATLTSTGLPVSGSLPSTQVTNTTTSTTPPSIWLGVGLGILTLLLGAATLVLAARYRSRRWYIYGVGGVISLVSLTFFFSLISQLLPASI
jgi:sortase A